MLQVQDYLKTHSLEDLKDEFAIRYKVYNDRVILKYGVDSKPKFHPIVTECRGLILSLPDYDVMARGFDRFFNLGEGDDSENFDWNNCLTFNKLDGSMCKVYYDGKLWCVSTNGTAFAEGETPMGKTYHDLFVEAIGVDLQQAFYCASKQYTYIFELTSPENRIVTRYHETKATLLAIRHNNGEYVDNDDYYDFSFSKKCESYNINDVDDILKFVEGRDCMDEGVVCYCPYTQVRIKVKNSAYVAIHRLKGEGENSIKGFVELAFKQEYVEFLLYFPEYTDTMMKYVKAHQLFLNQINDTWNKYKHIEDQKKFAMKIKDMSISGILFSLKKGIKLDDIIKKFNMDRKIKHLNNFI